MIRHFFASLALFFLLFNQVLSAPFTITDVEGRQIHFDKAPQRFIVANYIANYLLVGGPESLKKVVGMTKDGWQQTRFGEYEVFTRSFPEIEKIESIGGYHDDILNAEKILSLKPDVLLIGKTQAVENNQRIKTFEKAGIKVVVLDYHAMKVANHTKSTEILGQLLGRVDVAREQNKTYKDSLEHVYKTIAALPDHLKNTPVYMETASNGVLEYGNSYNKDVLWGAILKNLSAASLAENNPQPYMALDKEYVIAGNPKVIFIGGSIWRNNAQGDQMRMGFTVPAQQAQERLRNISRRNGWDRIDAVKNGNVYGIDHGSLRNMADYTFTEYLAKALYPQAFAELDPQANLERFYQRYLPELKYSGTFMIRLNQQQ